MAQHITIKPNATVGAKVSVPAAITGGESPTEAEHNALRTAVASISTVLANFGLTLDA